jgi:uncharacterized protein (DUF302 family)
MSEIHREEHRMTRVDIATGVAFDEFVTALEKAAPPFDPEPIQRLVAGGGDWDQVRRVVAENAPNDLMVYAKIDAAPLLGIAGHRVRAVEYLIGNHVIAENMFRHDPRALLYAPLRMLVYSDADGNAVFTMDQPSAAFGSLGIPEVTEVGKGLDDKVSNLLRVAGVEVAEAFGREPA